MSEEHERLVAEFRALAETVLTRLEPVLQKAAAATADVASDSASTDTQPVFTGCSWCPVCALAALVRGEHHELLAFLAGQAAAFLALLREILDEFLGGPSGRSWTRRRSDDARCGANSHGGICPDQRDGQGLTQYPG